MRSIFVPVGESALAQLGRIARRERRHPSQQAAILLEQAIHQDERRHRPASVPATSNHAETTDARA
jgi:hypothetical protein